MREPIANTLILATRNPGKLVEFRALVPADCPLLSLADVGIDSPEETGRTFRENANLKAVAAAQLAGMLALADDSGLEVDALRGAPGIRSARFAGEPPDDVRNRAALLTALSAFSPSERIARFVCAVTIASPTGDIWTADGEVRGTILDRERGTGGFGYDPLFLLPTGQTMAELLDEEKNAVSHRGRAMTAILSKLRAACASWQPNGGLSR